MRKKIISILLAVVIVFTISACNKNDKSDNYNNSNLNYNEPETPGFVTSPMKYSFPEFLFDKDKITLLSRKLYTSFDYDSANKEIESMLIEGNYTDFCFSEGKYYRYKHNGLYGVMDASGNVKLEAVYSDIEQLRSDLFILQNGNKKTYAFINSAKDFVISKEGEYDWIYKDNQLEIAQTEQELTGPSEETVDGTKYYLETPNGKVVYNKYYDLIVEASFNSFDSQISGKCCYSAYSDESYFILIFDEYYNLTVYEGSYGSVAVNFEDSSGSCYILSRDDYDQIRSLAESFKYTECLPVPSAVGDNIVITFGTDKTTQEVLTMYSDGFCLLESVDENGKKELNYYNIDTYAFVDTVDWVNTVLSKEYVTEQFEE